MVTTVNATFDGSAFHPDEPVALQPNSAVKLTIETIELGVPSASFLDVARSLKIEGPEDWSENVDKYLYGDGARGGQ